MQWFVEIVDRGVDGAPLPIAPVVVKRLGPYSSERLALKAEQGVTRNLNHERFFTAIGVES